MPKLDLDTLYISYNEIEASLVESQVLAYQRGLIEMGARVSLLTFEKEAPADPQAIRARLAAQGLAWDWLPYSGHLGSLGTARDIAAGARFILARRGRFDFVHCRSFFPAAMARCAQLLDRSTRFLFDVRGFFGHEKRYKGRIRSEWQFRLADRLEQGLFRSASAIVTLTDAAMRVIERDFLVRDDPVPRRVIPTCADVGLFLKDRRPLDAQAPRIVYSGSLGAGYMCEEVFQFFATVRRTLPDASLEVLTRSDPQIVRAGALKAGLEESDYSFRALSPSEMPDALLQCDAALSFIKPDFSKIASCPTKMAEYLAAGLPVVANAGIGDVDAQLSTTNTGVVMRDFSEAEQDRAITGLKKLLQDRAMIERARAAAQDIFSLELGVARYAEIYEALGSAHSR